MWAKLIALLPNKKEKEEKGLKPILLKISVYKEKKNMMKDRITARLAVIEF